MPTVDPGTVTAPLNGVLPYAPAFPAVWAVDLAADTLRAASGAPAHTSGHIPEGPTWRITVSPGGIRIGTVDYGRADRSATAAEDRRELDGRLLAGQLDRVWSSPYALVDDPLAQVDVPKRTRITGWSPKSRVKMVTTLGVLDYGPLIVRGPTMPPAMMTLTYPGEWESVCPDGKTVKGHLRAFQLRYRRRWGHPLVGVWKQEFQGRGAPHFHILMAPPVVHSGRNEFREWARLTWADVVAHEDPLERMKHEGAGVNVDWPEGLRMTDPRRVGVYFLKHGLLANKEYQHVVPAAWREPGKGPGRFWGYWGLDRVERPVEVTPAQAYGAARVVRRWQRAGDRAVFGRTEGGMLVERITAPTRSTLVERQRLRGMPYGGAPIWAEHEIGYGRPDVASARVRPRKLRRRIKRMRGTRGFLSVNDGAVTALMVATYLASSPA